MNILFMCVANSARSQIAEGLARHMFPSAEIQSAGSKPSTVNPFALAVMNEIGIDISKQYSKSIDNLSAPFSQHLHYIITLCAEEVCPIMVAPKAQRLHWPIPDPATKELLPEAEMLLRFRKARETIQEKLKAFKIEIDK